LRAIKKLKIESTPAERKEVLGALCQSFWVALVFAVTLSVANAAQSAGRAKDGDFWVSKDGGAMTLATVEGELRAALTESSQWIPSLVSMSIIASVAACLISRAFGRVTLQVAVLASVVFAGVLGLFLALFTWTEALTVGLAFWIALIVASTFLAIRQWWARAIELLVAGAVATLPYFTL
jgi:hypothetical protein